MKPTLFEVTGKNRYCGPTAIATILGVSTDDAAAMVRVQTGRTRTMRVAVRDLVSTLVQAGCAVSRFNSNGPKRHWPTAAAWIRAGGGLSGGLPKAKHVVLMYGHHYGTILGSRYLCSLTDRCTVPLSSIPKRRARVSGFLVIDRLPDQAPVTLSQQRAVDGERPARTKAKALCAKYGIEIEKSDGSIIVWGLRDLPDADDPYSGDHYAEGWADALERVKAYAEIAQRRLDAASPPAGSPTGRLLRRVAAQPALEGVAA